jgi:Glyoxalase-like domain
MVAPVWPEDTAMIHPVPTLDHVVINVRDQIDAGADTYRRLGFALTERGYHTLGSMNHLAMFGTDYLELIAAETGSTRRPEILAAHAGLNGIVFASEDAAATHAAMTAAGVPVFPAEQFSRPVVLPEGTSDAVFRTVRLHPEAVPAGRVYFCQHFTRPLVWRDAWRHHANGVTGIARAVVVAADPGDVGGLFGRMFGADAVRPIMGGQRLTAGLASIDVLTEAALRAEFGAASPDPDGRDHYMAALVFRTRSLDAAARALEAGSIAGARVEADRVIVPASAAFGATLAFCL